MLFRSTGLGKTELVGEIDTLQRQGDYLVMYVDVVDPVKWRIRACVSFRDIAKLGASCARAAILSFLLSPRQWRNGSPRHPGEF